MRVDKKALLLFLISFLVTINSSKKGIAADNCTDAGCHDKYLKEKIIHAPVRGRNCD